MSTRSLSPATLARIGITGGMWGGMVGGGTGTVTVPSLASATDMPRPRIHGTSSMTNVAATATGSVMYALAGGRVDFHLGLGLMIGGVIGAYLGARLTTKLPELWLRVAFLVVVAITAVKLALEGAGIGVTASAALLPPAVLHTYVEVLLISGVIGLIVGTWSSALGLGGGLLVIPAMLILFGAEVHVASGTSLLVMLPNAIVSALTHLRHKTADARIGGILAAWTVPGTILGVTIALLLSTRILSIVLAIFMTYVVVRDVLKIARGGR